MSVWPVSPPCYHHAKETTVVLTTSSNAQLKVLSPTVLHPVFLDICMVSKKKQLEKKKQQGRSLVTLPPTLQIYPTVHCVNMCPF